MVNIATPKLPGQSTNPLPYWIRRYLSQSSLTQITTAIHGAERATTGEIVPMVVRRSTPTGHVFPLAVLGLWLLYFTAEIGLRLDAWRTPHLAFVALDLAVLAIVAYAASLSYLVQRLLTSRKDLEHHVRLRAELVFGAAKLHETTNATGILLFVSVAERRAVVLGDRNVAKLLPQECWTEVVDLMIHGIKRDGLGRGLADAVTRCGILVAAVHPSPDGGPNELRDTLVIKE